MELTITPQIIITAAAYLGAASALVIAFVKLVRWVDKQKAQDLEISQLKKEQQELCFGMLAALDGLKQLGANGNVTKAHDRLEKHLNEQSHK